MAKSGRKTGRKKKLLAALVAAAILTLCVLGFFQAGVWYTAGSWEHWRPDYGQTDIQPLLLKSERTEEEYRTLYRQTGLTKLGIDGLLDRGDIAQILRIQTAFFTDWEVRKEHFSAFTYMEEIDGHYPLAQIEDGDILVSAAIRFSWFRYGHAALVVNANEAEIVESVMPGSYSRKASVYTFDYLANFLILRPKAEESVKKQVAKYASENLVGVPYRLTTGIFSKKFDENEFSHSQCAHLVWYAYKKFGIDLDSTGGAVVKPQDIARSEYVEVVQTFGFDPNRLWN